ncbi:MAG: hypothetical protein JWO12_657 [Frankiales bacterium]|nr:hypothetical protein [Frankiales bacterium]
MPLSQQRTAGGVISDPTAQGGAQAGADPLSGGTVPGDVAGGAPGVGPGVSGSGGSAVAGSNGGAQANPGGTTATAIGAAGSGFGWDSKNIYIGVPTADDFNKVVKAAGANFNNGDVHADIDAIVKDINSRGGVLGRKIVIAYHDAATTQYSSNPSVVAQSMCSYFTQDRPVVAVINGSPQLEAQGNFHTCLEKKQVTLLSLSSTVYSSNDYTKLGPHLFSIISLSTDVLVPAFVGALKRQGFFSGWDTTLGAPGKAPVKVGLLLPDDTAGRYVGKLFKATLARAGQQPPVEYYYPPAGSGTQSQSEVLAFTSAKVTHVLNLPPVELEIALFQRQAEQQHYRPRYGFTSFDLPLTVEENAVVAPPAQQVGSMGIGWLPLNDTNASHDAGLMPGGKRCFATLKAGGQSFDSSSRRAAFSGAALCDGLYLLRDALIQAKRFTGDDLLRAMSVVGPRFAPAVTFGSRLSGENHGIAGYYTDQRYDSACSCFTYVGGRHAFSAAGR